MENGIVAEPILRWQLSQDAIVLQPAHASSRRDSCPRRFRMSILGCRSSRINVPSQRYHCLDCLSPSRPSMSTPFPSTPPGPSLLSSFGAAPEDPMPCQSQGLYHAIDYNPRVPRPVSIPSFQSVYCFAIPTTSALHSLCCLLLHSPSPVRRTPTAHAE